MVKKRYGFIVLDLPTVLKNNLNQLFLDDPTAKSIGVTEIAWAPGESSVRSVLTENFTNFLGVGHGGFLFTLADVALSFASNSYGRKSLAMKADITYHRGVSTGDEVVASAVESSRSRRFASYQIELRVGGELVASATGLTFRTDEWHLSEEDWPEDWKNKY
tara:strand:+ start:1890 stop:2375 length:486 start_codon:yes stop_codon:yes gene_type:complete